MDSDEDMHDANGSESLEDDFYSEDMGMESDDGDADYDFGNEETDEDAEDVTFNRQQVMKRWFLFSFFVELMF